MSFEATLGLSLLELLHVLNKKFTLECARVREIRLPPGVGSVTTLEAEIESLKARADEALKLIPSLKNLLQPINRLPPEILSRIARHIPDPNAKNMRSIIPMTHVCRYWRNSIISTPENWTLISSEPFGLAELSLERCKAAPLRLWLDTPDLGTNPQHSLRIQLAPCFQNIEALYLHRIPTVKEVECVLQNFLQSMPNLRSLSLGGPIGVDWDWFKDPCEPLDSALTHLSLTDIPLYPLFLRLRTLKTLSLHNLQFNLGLDTLLDFLEENPSLGTATLDIQFLQPSLRNSRRRVPIENQLQNLSIYDTSVDENSLISKIAVQRGAHLEITLRDCNAGPNDGRAVVPMSHLFNLHSPTFMEDCPGKRSIRGPNGSFSLTGSPGKMDLFYQFSSPPFNGIRAFHVMRHALGEPHLAPVRLFPPYLPALETLSIEGETRILYLLSKLFSTPSCCPSLKTLAFLDCDLDGGFMEEFTRFASNRKTTTSAWLHRVVVVDSNGELPSVASINALGKHVPVVDFRVGKELPTDLQ